MGDEGAAVDGTPEKGNRLIIGMRKARLQNDSCQGRLEALGLLLQPVLQFFLAQFLQKCAASHPFSFR